MALDNLISVAFSSEELEQLNTALSSIETVLKGKTINLSPEDRRQYGSIADRNKVWVEKCKTYMDSDSRIVPPTLDKDEFDKDYEARMQIDLPLKRLARIAQMLTDTKTMLDFDNYNGALAMYQYVKYLSSQNEAGVTSVYQDLKKHFMSAKTAQPTPPTSSEDGVSTQN